MLHRDGSRTGGAKPRRQRDSQPASPGAPDLRWGRHRALDDWYLLGVGHDACPGLLDDGCQTSDVVHVVVGDRHKLKLRGIASDLTESREKSRRPPGYARVDKSERIAGNQERVDVDAAPGKTHLVDPGNDLPHPRVGVSDRLALLSESGRRRGGD